MIPAIIAAATLLLSWCLIMPVRFARMKDGNDTPGTMVLKGLPTAVAAGLALWAALQPGTAAYAGWMAAGLILCLLGDMVLCFCFPAGGGLFLCGHICYVAGLTTLQGLTGWHGLVFGLALVLLEGALYLCRRKMPDPLLAVGVYVYAAALAALLAMALPLPFSGPDHYRLLAAVGAVLFVLSDATLCDNLLNQRPLPNQYVSLGIYYTAQFFLCLSAVAVL